MTTVDDRINTATAFNDAAALALRIRAIGIKPAADLTDEEEELYTRYRDLGLVQGDARSVLPVIAHWLHTLAEEALRVDDKPRPCSCSWGIDSAGRQYVVAYDVDCVRHGWTEPTS